MRMVSHKTNGVTEFGGGPHDRAIQATTHLHALCLYMSALVADPENHNGIHQERQIDTLNREIVANAFDALAFLAAWADFNISEIE
jgi:hypothetical protein